MGIPTSGYIRDRRGESHISKHGDKIENKKNRLYIENLKLMKYVNY